MKNFYKKEYITNFLKENKISKTEFVSTYKIPISVFDSIYNGQNIYLKYFSKIYKIIGEPKDFFDVCSD